MKIEINFLQHRRNFIPLFVYLLNKIKEENKKHIKLNLLLTDRLDLSWISELTNIDYQVINYQ